MSHWPVGLGRHHLREVGLKLVWLDGSEVTQVQLRGSLQVALGLVLPLSSSTLPVATEHRIRAGADAAMGYPRFGMLDLPGAASRVCPVPMNQGSDTRDAPPRRYARLSTGKRSFGRPAGPSCFRQTALFAYVFLSRGTDGSNLSAPTPESSVSALLAPSVAADLHPYDALFCTPLATPFRGKPISETRGSGV